MTSALTTTLTAIINARVVPVIGETIANGTVLIENGRISAVGADLTVPIGAQVIDATGRWVLPGFIEAHGHVGIHEAANGWAGNDTNEMTGPNMTAVRAIDAINTDDEGFRDAISGGVSTIVVKPGSGNPIGGQSVAIKSSGGRTIDEQVISDSVSIKRARGENPKRIYGEKKQTPSTRLGVSLIIRQAVVDARNYVQARDAAAEKGDTFTRDLGQEALARVLSGELAWDQHVHQASPAVKEGLPAQTALEALTVNPAVILGLDSRVGSLTVGLDADVVIWSGDPLDLGSRAELVLIDGTPVYRHSDGFGQVVERADRASA
ncbi:amidohydrolase family protein [Cryobacterium sp. TMS1-13-1]|uniref:amidohydrolase family protein n=1 Tax=Cryobacterium sp. TMS1-13-1 TaxID=1259220 RepID=UPI00106A7BC3|nr:amidohydrolase family protein [Cryobacterium sp. TMS1-13-1]TFD21655.1 hypothetical protein E3T31_12885 [Cryobacterium sp. TMS1-13-1]